MSHYHKFRCSRSRRALFLLGRHPERFLDQWLMCMRVALDEVVADAELRGRLFETLAGLADHMRNRPEPET